MSARTLPRFGLVRAFPPLVEPYALVALVPLSGNPGWAAHAAWDAARAVASTGRAVTLIDLRLDDPSLQHVVRLTPTDGIVDAFEFGVSLTKTAHAVDGVYFITSGSDTADPGGVIANPRWRRLQAGYRHEGALLLLYVAADDLARLGATPDCVIALAPAGEAPAELAGLPVEAAVRDDVMAAPPPPPPPAKRPVTRSSTGAPRPSVPAPVRRASRRRTPRLAIALAIAAAAAGAVGWWTLIARAREAPPHAARHAPEAAPPESAAVIPPGPLPAFAPSRADSLYWTIQLAAYGAPAKAVAQADRLTAQGVGAFVTPLVLDQSRTVWYRVLAGSYASRAAAAAARDTLRRRGLAAKGEGALLRAPYSLKLAPGAPLDRLRAAGLLAADWGGGGIALLGAFESPDQAATADAALRAAGVAATLITRTGTTP